MLKRLFDIIFSTIGLLILSPVFLIFSILIKLDSKGPIFYLQTRVGKQGKDFKLFKFRTMRVDSDKKGLLTVGHRDNRITKVGYYLRKYKVDEFPQFLNILIGDMSFVGPRPEVRRYVDLYDEHQQKVLDVKPGLTDYASIEYVNENELLKSAKDPEQLYINEIMPAKLNINLRYIANRSFFQDIKILFLTAKAIVS
ncbi:sugar transferase [Fulvivirgaceae bacterium BMA10]|uniref:Sugar transferase n=1 Tax=Splendidivirga corallicola TaxID=3051826 RepID=A0ABT8KX76_9BACT|nr:sugar transferase [Fulvivirgaceae bacterium BMA10]